MRIFFYVATQCNVHPLSISDTILLFKYTVHVLAFLQLFSTVMLFAFIFIIFISKIWERIIFLLDLFSCLFSILCYALQVDSIFLISFFSISFIILIFWRVQAHYFADVLSVFYSSDVLNIFYGSAAVDDVMHLECHSIWVMSHNICTCHNRCDIDLVLLMILSWIILIKVLSTVFSL